MSGLFVIGVDPGPVPGLVLWNVPARIVQVAQSTWSLTPLFVDSLIDVAQHANPEGRLLLAIEAFVVRGRAGRSSTAGAGETTRYLIGALGDVGRTREVTNGWAQRSASQVKPWATDERLAAAGLLEACKGMRHARDAARHALFAACHDGGVPDPLSKEWRAS